MKHYAYSLFDLDLFFVFKGMAKKKTKPQLKTKQEIFIREWILLCLEQLGYSSILKKNEKVNSALELLSTNSLIAKKKVNE